MKKIIFTLLFMFTALASNAQTVLHFTVKYGFPMIGGEANGKFGWFLLDTGTPLNFILNNKYVPIEYNRRKGMGCLSSGQQFELCQSDSTIDLTIDTLNVSNILASNGDVHFMENITQASAFLGFIGYGFLKDYKFVLDYKDGTCTLYPHDSEVIIDTDKHPLLACINYTEDEHKPQIPMTIGSIGGVPISIAFDTGASSGWVNINQQMNKFLTANKSLSADIYGTYRLKNLFIGNLDVPTLKGLHYSISSTSQIILSHEFLKHYITIWDYSNHTIEIYRNEGLFFDIFGF